MASGARPKVARRLQRRVQSIVLVAWLCLRPAPGDDRDPDFPHPNQEAP